NREMANTGAVLAYALVLFSLLEILPWKRGNLKAAAFMVGIVGNTVYIGFPLLADAFGKTLLPYSIAAATVHLVLGLILSILAVEFWVIKSKRASAYIVDFFKNPFFTSLAVGVFLSMINFKGPVAEMIQKPIFMLGSTASPLALFALGGFLHGKFALHHLSRSVALTLVKLVAFPALVWFFVRLLGLGADFTAISVIVASMPSAVTAFVIAEKYHLDNELVANTILLSTAVSVLTISLFLLRFI
ncbi:MAG: AEC family transporter, partial [Patescibacteria group bacterium]|nr:AEC family transporter [Patescibacteria group bacterium]